MLEFNQPMTKFHAMDLCDLEHTMEGTVSMADLAVPCLASTFRPSGDDDMDMQVEVDPSAPLTVGDIQPVWWAIKTLRCMIDDRIHIQQMAGTAQVGYVPMYQHILELKDGHKNFSGSRSDKDYWNKQKLEFEKDILKERSHSKQVANASGKSGKTHLANVSAPSSAQGSKDGRTAKQRHNAHNPKAYDKCKKALKEAAK